MSEEDKFVAALRWFFHVALGCLWFMMLMNKLDKIIHLLEAR